VDREQVKALGRAIRKGEGGKLFSVDVQCKEGKIVGIKIAGEFFADPELLLDSIEVALLGVRLEEASVTAAIEDALSWSKGTLVGLEASDLSAAIVEAGKVR
jgi:hypothetical protein